VSAHVRTPMCRCGAALMSHTTNTSSTVQFGVVMPLVTVKWNYRCPACHAEVTFVHHSGDDPAGFTNP